MENKVIVITGAGSGVGRDCAQLFLEEGWRVALLGRRIQPLEETAQGHKNSIVVKCDVSNYVAVETAFATIISQWNYIDVLFNNAGLAKPSQTIDELSIDDWAEVVNINLNGSFFCAKVAFKAMRNREPQGGRIINNGSVSAYVPRPGSAPYTSTKHAITGLTKSISLDGRPFNIACGQIDIGNALTPMAHQMTIGVPQANGTIQAEATMDPHHVSKTVLHMAELPLETNVQFVTVMASTMPYIGRG
jgi:NAD(P)-dependent dehydrogenase (short-subunit alcohol dehydrogenase family)